MIEVDNNPEQQAPVWEGVDLAALDHSLGEIPDIREIGNIFDQVTARHGVPEESDLNREETRMITQMTDGVDEQLDSLAFAMFGQYGMEQTLQMLKDAVVTDMPKHLHSMALDFLESYQASFGEGNSSAQLSELSVDTPTEIDNESGDHSLQAIVESINQMVSEDPAQHADIIEILAKADKSTLAEHSHVKAFLQAIIVPRLRNGDSSLRRYITAPPKEVTDILFARHLYSAHHAGDSAVVQTVEFARKFSETEMTEDQALARILQLDPKDISAFVHSSILSKVREQISRALFNHENIGRELNVVSEMAADTRPVEEKTSALLRGMMEMTIKVFKRLAAENAVGHRGIKHVVTMPPQLRALEVFLNGESKRLARQKASIARATVDEEVQIETIPVPEVEPRVMVAATVTEKLVHVNGKTVEDIVKNFTKKMKGGNKTETETTLNDLLFALSKADFSAGFVSGVKQLQDSGGVLRDQHGPVKVFELKPSEFSDFATKGPLMKQLRIIFTLQNDGSMAVLRIVPRHNLVTSLRQLGLSATV